MEIVQRERDGVVILVLKGKMTLGEGDVMFKERVESLQATGKTKFLVDLGGIPYLDSAGLGELVRTYLTTRRNGGWVKLLNITKRIEDILTLTKLITVFETFDSEDEAVASFEAPQPQKEVQT